MPNSSLADSCSTLQDKPQRLDAFLTAALPPTTRSKVQAAIEAGSVLVGNTPQLKPSYQVHHRRLSAEAEHALWCVAHCVAVLGENGLPQCSAGPMICFADNGPTWLCRSDMACTSAAPC